MNKIQKLRLATGKVLFATALAAGIVTGTQITDARAAGLGDSSMRCAEGTETMYFGLPIDSAPRFSIYAYSVNGGAWQWTDWYWTEHSNYAYWDASAARYVKVPADSSQRIFILGNRKTVVGWEYRFTPSTNSGGWFPLGTCTTTSFFGDPIIYR